MVCNPSLSFNTSAGVRPCTAFQYCDDTTGMRFIVKYLFSRSNAAIAYVEAHPRWTLSLQTHKLLHLR